MPFRIFYYLGVSALVLIVTVFLALGQMVDVEKYRPRILEALETITSRPVSVGKIVFSPAGGFLTLELKDLEVHALDTAEPPMLLVKKVRLGIAPLSFLHSRIQISSLTLIQPQFNIVQRTGTRLMRRAQDSAKQSDMKMERELGLGLTELSIGKIKIQNGILTVLDWEHPQGRTLIFDRIQAGIHALSPTRASPVSASARFQSIPFTVNGQVGPLPDSLDPFEMPVLLSLEAKSAGLSHLEDLLTDSPIHLQGARGYFSTLFHGSLKKGLQTSSRLELDKLTVGSKPKKEDKSMDIAFRQKSVLRIRNGQPSLKLEEFFVYLDGTPLMDIKGIFYQGLDGQIKLEINTLDSVDLERFIQDSNTPISGGSPRGNVQIVGDFSESMTLKASLDLSKTALLFPPFQKKAGIPLSLTLEAVRNGDTVILEDMVFIHPNIPGHHFRVSGTLHSKRDLKTKGEWELSLLGDYFPMVEQWQLAGLARMDMSLQSGGKDEKTPLKMDGSVRMDNGSIQGMRFQSFSTTMHGVNDQLNFSKLEIRAGEGYLDGHLLVDLSEPLSSYQALFAFSGISMEKLTEKTRDDLFGVEGLAFGQAEIYGTLDEGLFPVKPYFGKVHLEVEPGRVTHIDGNAFLHPPVLDKTITSSSKSLYWNQLESDLYIHDSTVQFNNLLIKSGELLFSGNGKWHTSGNLWFDVKIQTNPKYSQTKIYNARLEGNAKQVVYQTKKELSQSTP